MIDDIARHRRDRKGKTLPLITLIELITTDPEPFYRGWSRMNADTAAKWRIAVSAVSN